MAPIELPSVVVFSRGVGVHQSGDAVVWLGGDHDISTVAALAETMARVIALDDADLVVDLSGVRFIGAATVEVLGRARDFLQVHSRALTLRSPPARVSRVLELSGLADLVDPSPAGAVHLDGTAGALGTWVAVPATERADRDGNDPEPSGTPESGASRVSTPSEVSLDSRQHARGRPRGVAGRRGP
jgi:anti-anti-sigma factor